jgi:hypothetical protein
MAGTTPDPVGNVTDARSFTPHQTCCTHELSYPLVFSTSFPSLSHISLSLPLSQNTKLSHPYVSLHAMIMRWHWVQHSPYTATFQDCLSSLHSQDYNMTHECSFSFQRASLQERPPPASLPYKLPGKVTSSHSHGCKLTNWWMESQHPVCLRSTASKFFSNLARSWPPSGSPTSLDHGLQVHIRNPQSRPPNTSPN